jgi:predicted transcriptional regulator
MKFLVDCERGLLTTRSEGESNRHRLEAAIRSQPSDSLEISFEGVEALTISFADEFLGRLLTELQSAVQEPVPVLVTGLNADTAVELDVVLERRKLQVASFLANELKLLGGDRLLKETFLAAVQLHHFTPAQLGDEIDTSVQNVNNRLKRLLTAGALQRTRVSVSGGGREYEYRVPDLFNAPAAA